MCGYILASAHDAIDMRGVAEKGQVEMYYSAVKGIRPVVSLKPTVKTTGTDIIGAWDIEVAE